MTDECPASRRGTRCCGGGQGRGRTGDLSLFRRTLLPAELPGLARCTRTCGPDAKAVTTHAITASATPTGLEPATSAVTGRRANQLRYGAWCALLIEAPAKL